MAMWTGNRGLLLAACLAVGCTKPAEDGVADSTTGTGAPEDSSDSGSDSDGDDSGSDSSGGAPAGCEAWEVPTIGSLQTQIASTDDGSLWVADSTEGPGDSDWVLGRYNLDGELLATREYGGPREDSVDAIASGPEPGLYVLGRLGDDPEFLIGDAVLTRFDGESNEVWSAVVTLDGEVFAAPRELVVNEDGSSYVVGSASDSESEEGPEALYSFVAKFSPTGEQQWFDLLFGGDMYSNRGRDVAPDRMGGVYAVGDSASTLSGEPGAGLLDLWIAHYSADGNRDWFNMIGGELRESVRDADADPDGNLYIAVHTDPQVGPPDVPLLLKLDPDGGQQWSLNGDLDSTHLTSLSVDSSGDLYAYYQRFEEGLDESTKTLAKYDADGTLLSTRDLSEQLLGTSSMVLSPDDEVYFGDARGADGHYLVHLCSDT